MPSLTARFGPFIPDLPIFGNPGSQVVKNCLPIKGGYEPARQVAPFSEPLTDTALAARFVKSSDDNVFGFAATETELLRLARVSFGSVGRPQGYNTPIGSNWDFEQFGDQLFATNFGDPIQQFDLTSSTRFEDVPDIPNARYLATVNNFLVIAHLNDNGLVLPSAVQWSSNNNPTNFPVPRSDEAVQTLSDRQVLPTDFGAVTGLVPGLNGADALVLQERAATRMSFVRGRTIFDFDTIEGARGCNAAGSVVQVGGLVYYLDNTGVFVSDGQTVTPIGASQIDKFLYDVLDITDLAGIRSAEDVRRKLVYWFIPTKGQEDGTDITLVFNYDIGQWTFLDGFQVKTFVRTLASGFKLEDLDQVSTSIETLPASLDSDIWRGGGLPVFSAINEDNRLGPVEGETLGACLRTPEAELTEDARTYVQFSRPLVDASNATVTPYHRDNVQSPPTKGKTAQIQVSGRCLHRLNARYAALEMNIPAGTEWTSTQGIQVIHEPSGRRQPSVSSRGTLPNNALTTLGVVMLMNTGAKVALADVVEQVVTESTFLITSEGDRLITSAGDQIVLSAAA